MVSLVCMAWGTASAQYLISTKKLGPKKQYTDNKNRSYVVAGCLPKKMPKPSGFTGSTWIACNDLNYVKDKVVESEFISCIDKYPNGVVSSFTIEEFKNRKWKSFKFGCKNMGSDGKLSGLRKAARNSLTTPNPQSRIPLHTTNGVSRSAWVSTTTRCN